jgi:actin-like ATPase involved in cell morphogenesis
LLGEGDVPVETVLAALYRHVREVALAAAGAATPGAVRLTYPATWGTERRAALQRAATEAGFDAEAVELVAEPVAAAVRIAEARIGEGKCIAVYDLGGGTFDAAVLRRSRGEFMLAGAPGGLDDLGGQTFDHRILEHLGRSRLGQSPDWVHLLAPADARWLRARSQLMEEIRGAKERVSTTRVTRLWVPELNEEFQLTRDELEHLIGTEIDRTVEMLSRTIASSGVAADELGGVYLVGASSRIPLVAATLWKRLTIEPKTEDDPKSIVALGATQRARPETTAEPEPEPGTRLAEASMPVKVAPALARRAAPASTVPLHSFLVPGLVVLAVVVVVAVALAASVGGSAKDDDSSQASAGSVAATTDTTTSSDETTTDNATPSAGASTDATDTTPVESQPPAKRHLSVALPTTTYRNDNYALSVPASWNQVEDEEGAFDESKWESPTGDGTLLIDHSAFSGTPRAGADPLRAKVSKLSGYNEIAYKSAGNGLWRWEFSAEGRHTVDYFASSCGHAFAVLGKASSAKFASLKATFRKAATSLEMPCTTGSMGASTSTDNGARPSDSANNGATDSTGDSGISSADEVGGHGPVGTDAAGSDDQLCALGNESAC